MSFLLNGVDISSNFYKKSIHTNTIQDISNTGFLIENDDIRNIFVPLKTNSKIPVSQMLTTTNFKNKNNVDISTLFELNLITFTGTIDTDYKIWSPANHDGFLIQILTTNATMTFNYNVSCNFAMIGGGGGGGGNHQSNAGGGGGAGELVTGTMEILKGKTVTFTIGQGGTRGTWTGDNVTGTYGSGNGTNTSHHGNSGTPTVITCNGFSIDASGGGGGGGGKGSSESSTSGCTGGTGSYSNATPSLGTLTVRTLTNNSVFKSLSRYPISGNGVGARGQNNNNDDGAGGGGGGVEGNGSIGNNQTSGGSGRTIQFGSTNFTIFTIGGGGGGGTAKNVSSGGGGGSGGGGNGGYYDSNLSTATASAKGDNAANNTGGGGGGAYNGSINIGGNGGSGTVIIYIVSSNIS